MKKKCNEIDEFIYKLELKMLRNKIKKKDLYNVINRNTVTKLFSKHEGTVDTIRKVLNYIEEVEKNE